MQAFLNEPAVQYQSAGSSVRFNRAFNIVESQSTILKSESYFSEQVAGLLQRLNRIAELPENWDSYGAEVPNEVALANARRFIIENSNTLLPFYFIAPGVNGEVMIEFNLGNKSAELYFNPDGGNELLLYRHDETELEGTLEDDFDALMDFFDE